MPRILILIPSETYRAADFLQAARRLGIEITVGSDRRNPTARDAEGGVLQLPLDQPELAADAIVEYATETSVDAIVAVDDQGVLTAAIASKSLQLPYNAPSAVKTTRDKAIMRERLARRCVSQPPFVVVRSAHEALTAAEQLTFPVVIKPISLSASQGVIRIDKAAGIPTSVDRVRRILAKRGRPSNEPLLIEKFIPGKEVAVEGLLSKGGLTILAIFDKPDPLNGPFFEETLYVTPSRLPRSNQNAICSVTSDASVALGLTEGPIHAELRVQGDHVSILEIASRSIGGLCARSLRFGLGVSLEQLILRHAIRLPIREITRTDSASGVMMLPIHRSGRLVSVEGVEQAREIPGVAGVEITMSPGQDLVPLPEGNQYLGYVFARGCKAADVESALRQAHAKLLFNVQDD